jgi:hypothetical protein
MKKLLLSILLTIMSVFAFARLTGEKPLPRVIASSSVYFTNAYSGINDLSLLNREVSVKSDWLNISPSIGK